MVRLTAALAAAIFLFGCGKDAGDGELEPCGEACAEISASPRIARLSHAQWERSTQDLLLLDAPSGLSDSFIGDTLSEGFSTDASGLQVSATLWQDYQRAAEQLAREMVAGAGRYNAVVLEDQRDPISEIDFHDVIEAEDTSRVDYSTGGQTTDGYNLWTNGTLGADVQLPQRGNYTVATEVWATRCGSELPRMRLDVDGAAVLEVEVLAVSRSATERFEAVLALEAGLHRVEVSFLNDCNENGEDRNLIVDRIEVIGQEGGMGASSGGEAEARAFIARFGARAHRRPLDEAEVSSYLELWAAGPELVGSGDDFADGVRIVVQAMLQSPFFVYRTELSTAQDKGGRIALDSYELASKLSYSLWGTMPDEALFEAAEADALATEAGVREAAERLMGHPRARSVVRDFHAELLHTDAWGNINKDPSLFPSWDASMRPSMQEEPLRFAEDVVFESGEGVFTLYSAPWTYVDAKIAPLYGLSVAPGEAMVRVDLDPSKRAGLLTQVGFLSFEADQVESSIIHRGVHVARKVLCLNLPPPPDQVPPLPELQPGMTNRERVDAHTGPGTCGAGCHSTIINPAGFALENFDALGMWRVEDRGLPIDAAASYPLAGGEVNWSNPVDFAGALASSQEAHYCYVQHWNSWVHGRAPDDRDEARVARLGDASRFEDRPVRSLILDLVSDQSFSHRAPTEEGQ